VRRGIRLLMTVATTAVVAVAFRASMQPNTTTTGQAAVVSSATPTHKSTRSGRQTSRDGRRRSVPPTRATPTPSTPARTPAPSTPPTRSATPHPSATPTTSAPKSAVVAGGVVNTQYGPVQVEVTVRGGKIVKAQTLQHPSGDGQTDRINGYAVPQLDQETIAAQNAQIDTVSGATFTSGGYRQSLQSALDAAHQAGAL
jgi:uncharacterized protein with FMN-binding domain